MRCNILIFFILITLNSFVLKADTSAISHAYNTPEKIYLNLDDNIYTTDRKIRFNGVVVNANTHNTEGISEVIYVELINSEKEILDRKILKVTSGKYQGQLEIYKSYPSGLYLVRAYSNWNRNFDANFNHEKYVYLISTKENTLKLKQPIEAIELIDSNGIKTNFSAKFNPSAIDRNHNNKPIDVIVSQDAKVSKQTIEYSKDLGYIIQQSLEKGVNAISLELITSNEKSYKTSFSANNTIVIDFYPEGGILRDKTSNKIAFRATDKMGNGRKVEGYITNNLGKIVSKFTSNPYGIGSFVIRDLDANKTYQAHIQTDSINDEPIYSLPKIELKGTVVNLTENEDSFSIYMDSNVMMDESVGLKIMCRGKSFLSEQVDLKKGQAKILVPKKSLPKGVLKISMENKAKTTTIERFVFNGWSSLKGKVDLSSLESEYDKRDKVSLILDWNNHEQEYKNAHLSVLVKQKKVEESTAEPEESIASYLMLASDFNSKIESLNYYFEDNKEKDLHNLMLTLAIGDYKYSEQNKLSKFKKEKQLEITGVINPLSGKKNNDTVELLFMAMDDSRDLYIKNVSVPGNFQLPILDTYGSEVTFLVQPNGEKKDEKKQYKIAFNKPSIPEVDFDFSNYSFFKTEVILSKIDTYREIKKRTDDFNFKYYGSTELDEVIIDAYKMTPLRKQVADEHGLPREVIEEKELKEKTPSWHYGLYSVLEASFQDKMVQTRFDGDDDGRLYSYIHGVDTTLFLVDGKLVLLDMYPYIGEIDPSQITSLEVLDSPKNALALYLRLYPQARPPYPTLGIISIYTKAGEGIFGALNKTEKKYDIVNVPVFSENSRFEMPDYADDDFSESTLIDLRVPLYFNPDIQKGKDGKTVIEFFNSDMAGDYEILIEGSSGNGDFWQKTFGYRVKEDEK